MPTDPNDPNDPNADEVARLRAGIQAMLDGDYPHPRKFRHTTRKCPHGTPYYEECAQCDDSWLVALLKGDGP